MTHMNRILTGSIASVVKPFTFAPEGEGGGSTGNPPPNQQQQPPAADDFVSPFADIDRDLLDDQARAAVDKAEQEMRTMHGRVKAGASIQAERDRLLQHLQNPPAPTPPPPPTNTPLSLEQEMEQEYIANNIPAPQAKQLAQMNARIFDKHSDRLKQEIGSHLAPIAGQVFDNSAREAFDQASANDSLGRLAIPEVAQAVWEQTQAMARQGQVIDPAFVDSLSSIHYVRYLQANPGALHQSPLQTQQPQAPIAPQMQQQTRFSYPGAGRHVQAPATPPSNAPAMDPEVRAAMSSTVQHWSVKPKEFRSNGKAPSVITRG